MIPILREVAMLGGYLECVVEVYVVEMWSDGGAWWWMVEDSTLREGTGGKTKVERANKDLLELERREGK